VEDTEERLRDLRNDEHHLFPDHMYLTNPKFTQGGFKLGSIEGHVKEIRNNRKTILKILKAVKDQMCEDNDDNQIKKAHLVCEQPIVLRDGSQWKEAGMFQKLFGHLRFPTFERLEQKFVNALDGWVSRHTQSIGTAVIIFVLTGVFLHSPQVWVVPIVAILVVFACRTILSLVDSYMLQPLGLVV
jgi:hypothetical protein